MAEAGFAHAPLESALAFRPILDAMARPGRIMPFESDTLPPEGLQKEMAGILLTLCDFQTPVWLSPSLRTSGIQSYVRFQTGAPLVSNPGDASFGFAATSAELPPLSQFMHGTSEYPDRSATLAISVDQLTTGSGLRLSGPGIKGSVDLSVEPVGEDFWRQMMECRNRFPLGIDALFTANGAIVGLPRSTRLSFTGTS